MSPLAKYSFNKNYFDTIDNENKAYWLGFVWCDGTIHKRQKTKNHFEYSFKIDLKFEDREHLTKFKNDLESTHEIKDYSYKSSFDENKQSHMSRLLISNVYFGKNLHDSYGLVAGRSDASSVINSVPNHLFKHFIRGVLDADGSFSFYHDEDGYEKMGVAFSTYEEINTGINEFLYNEGVVESILKQQKRHDGKDGHCTMLKFSGINQSTRVLNYLYKDSNVYLDRKYIKYQDIIGR